MAAHGDADKSHPLTYPLTFSLTTTIQTHTHSLLLVLLLTLYKGCHRDVCNVVNGEKSKEEFSL